MVRHVNADAILIAMDVSSSASAGMNQQLFASWLAERTWLQVVRFCRVLVVLLPVAAVVIDWQPVTQGRIFKDALPTWILAWHLVSEVVALGILALDRFAPTLRARAVTNEAVAAVFVALSTWVGLTTWVAVGDFSLWALGLSFVATVICTPRHVRRPMYFVSAVVICAVVQFRTSDMAQLIANLINPLCVALICFQLDKYAYERNMDLFREKELVEFERRRADKVLYNVLPASIADELKANEKVNAVKFEGMGVMFADIVGFTSFSKLVPPEAIVLLLNQVFSAFDALVEKRGLEKIKTIGDAYMTVAFKDTAGLADLSLDMIEVMRQYNKSNGTDFQIRVGMHVGPAVAGVVGVKRFLYDVWGDTVNVASRMESSGEPGKVHVTESVYDELRERFSFVRLEPIEVKGKGSMLTYYLEGPIGERA